METTATQHPTHKDRSAWRFSRHYVEMLVAMIAGMMVFDPVSSAIASALGATAALDRADVGALVMATNMMLGMSAWMRLRGHCWAGIAEMGAAMFAPYLILLVPFWTGTLSGQTLMIAGHVLMLPAMLVAMLHRRDEYIRHHHGHAPSTSGRIVTALRRRRAT